MQNTGSYGAAEISSLGRARIPFLRGPIFLENPDGSIAEAIPSHLKDAKSKSSRRDRASDANDSDGSVGSVNSQTVALSMAQEVDVLYSRHERVFIALLSAQFLLELLYASVFVIRMRPSVVEFVSMYNWQLSATAAESILWFAFASQLLYSVAYYAMAGVALYTKRPIHFQNFSNCCLVGVVGLVMLAYLDKFNLPIFFLRLLAYIYARFLQGLTASILLLPPVPGTP